MKTIIYYFTGTGNSLFVARDVAEKLDGNLVSIPSIMKSERIVADAERIGIIFPVYFADLGGLPLIVDRFLNKLEVLGARYVFAICIHDGDPGNTIGHLKELLELKGIKLAAGYTVRIGVPYPLGLKMKKAIFNTKIDPNRDLQKDAEKQQKLRDSWKKKLDAISEQVINEKEGIFETIGTLTKVLKGLFLPLTKRVFRTRFERLAGLSEEKDEAVSKIAFADLIQLADNSFTITDKCNGCSICEKVCPVNNIQMIDNKPVWQHHCENCTACYAWCPNDAISGEIVAYSKKYHHPDVNLSEILKNNNHNMEVIIK